MTRLSLWFWRTTYRLALYVLERWGGLTDAAYPSHAEELRTIVARVDAACQSRELDLSEDRWLNFLQRGELDRTSAWRVHKRLLRVGHRIWEAARQQERWESRVMDAERRTVESQREVLRLREELSALQKRLLDVCGGSSHDKV
jgi:chromosome condensin MukBEF ATPase and DNA-binding subunit MukB